MEQIDWNAIPDEFVVFDLETTGLDPAKAEILEIGALRFVKANYLQSSTIDTYQSFVRQSKNIPPEITQINSITNEMVKNGSPLNVVINEFFEFVGDRRLVAYNASFEEKFIRAACKKLNRNIPADFEIVCALELARLKLSNMPNYRLSTVAGSFRVDTSGAHRALQDSLMTLHVYINLLNTERRLSFKGEIETRERTTKRYGHQNEALQSLAFALGRILGILSGVALGLISSLLRDKRR